MKKIRTGDQVIVISGKDKGKQGSVTKILSNGRCYVSGVQMVKRHTKPNPNAGVAGGIVEKESSIDIFTDSFLPDDVSLVIDRFNIVDNLYTKLININLNEISYPKPKYKNVIKLYRINFSILDPFINYNF